MNTRKVKINLKDMQQSLDYNIVFNQGKLKMIKKGHNTEIYINKELGIN